MKHIAHFETILYVSSQQASTEFYTKLFRIQPTLNVPGMTEFTVSKNCKLGLMPNAGIEKILLGKTPNPSSGNGIPRCELYLLVENIELEFENALRSGAKLISPIEARNWGDTVCYFADLDGHIIAFAMRGKS
ncbi:MAG: hypothetical protein M9931_10570 [Chitinophagales bacterium]|nr:hypothetical protein [Chitinophagales bacterium]MCO5281480.1 hypothetical protein [Chitinophagales bacterium]OJV27735.1 MAG: lactoylglutathione lyase [Bacteroidetes bacterium 37-13]HRN93435.1 hypothetical protein [Chitinophagales bacterium]HRP38505.1 hypothetical protein [Chitinophagales bacterium]